MRFGIPIFLAAFLLFLVQPLVGKLLLPRFGGTPAVWTTCLLFFQCMLLAGYAYAHALNRLPLRRSLLLHRLLAVVALSGSALATLAWSAPLHPPPDWGWAGTGSPQFQVLGLLLLVCGLPFFVLAGSSPLLQHWHAADPSARAETYRLYALSNVGSVLGLLLFPFLFEPRCSSVQQGWIWLGAFTVYVVSLWMLRPTGEGEAGSEPPSTSPRAHRFLWIALPAVSTAMLMALTDQLTQEIAAVPFLWVLPLTLYLLSYIICFDRPQWARRALWLPLCGIFTFGVLVTQYLGVRLTIPGHVIGNSLFLFSFCMLAHGELVALRPATRNLTRFYLLVALGGAIGGLLVGFVAPMLLPDRWEYHMTLMVGWVLFTLALYFDRRSPFFEGSKAVSFALSLLLVYIVVRLLFVFWLWRYVALIRSNLFLSALITTFLLAILLFLLLQRFRWYAGRFLSRSFLVLVLLLVESFGLLHIRGRRADVLQLDRNFFGVLRTGAQRYPKPDGDPALLLNHGHILHGFQYLSEDKRRLPVSYYQPGSGVHEAITQSPRRRAGEALHMGVMGLGVGTLAAFGREGDRVTFYEINPDVIELAGPGAKLFQYLNDSDAEIEVKLGDARHLLEQERRAGQFQGFDVLVMDAFTSDAIPVHLLTEEAIAVYLEHLRDDQGILAVNISNRFLDLRPVMAGIARSFDLRARIVVRNGKQVLDRTPSIWVLFSRDPEVLEDLGVPLKRYEEGVVHWTDQYSSIFPLLRY